MGFLVVGHTHEDIDGYLDICQKNEGGEQLPFSRFDEGFYDFIGETIHSSIDSRDSKVWILGPSCLKDGPKTLVGHTNMHIFRFFVDSLGWPMMQYKVSPTNLVLSLIDAPLIILWKANPYGLPKLPTGVPCLVPYCPLWGNNVSRSMVKNNS